jgi:hypothetical protein
MGFASIRTPASPLGQALCQSCHAIPAQEADEDAAMINISREKHIAVLYNHAESLDWWRIGGVICERANQLPQPPPYLGITILAYGWIDSSPPWGGQSVQRVAYTYTDGIDGFGPCDEHCITTPGGFQPAVSKLIRPTVTHALKSSLGYKQHENWMAGVRRGQEYWSRFHNFEMVPRKRTDHFRILNGGPI